MADTLHTSGSTSTTTGSSSSHTSKQGGSSTTTFGKTWASGKVEEKTQAQRDKYNEDYQEGAKVQATYQALQDTLNQKPTFQSSYQDKLNAIYDQIMNRDKFNYDFNADPMYQMYKDQYTQSGKQAMQDTMGQAAALSGGYGSSYAQTAGQQTYQGYLTQLNNMIPTLRDQAYQQYRDEGQEMRDKYNITSDAYNREYGQFRDSMSDWQSDRAFNYGMYSDERSLITTSTTMIVIIGHKSIGMRRMPSRVPSLRAIRVIGKSPLLQAHPHPLPTHQDGICLRPLFRQVAVVAQVAVAL